MNNIAAALIATRNDNQLVSDFGQAGKMMVGGHRAEAAQLAEFRGQIMAELDRRGRLGMLAESEGLCGVCWADRCDC